MIKNYSDCEKCIHASVCQYKLELKNIYDKISGKWDNLNPTDIFRLELICEQYKLNKSIKNDGEFFI